MPASSANKCRKMLPKPLPPFAVLLLALAPSFGSEPLRLYQIGNSHTWDSMPRNGFPFLVEDAGLRLVNGWHIECGEPLTYISQNPDEVCIPPSVFGTWPTALAENQWDVVTLQTHVQSTGAEELAAIQTIVSTIPEDYPTRILLYVNWPHINGRAYHDGWAIRYQSEDQEVIQSFAYFVWLRRAMHEAALGNVRIDCVPIGAVLAELDSRFRRGAFPSRAFSN